MTKAKQHPLINVALASLFLAGGVLYLMISAADMRAPDLMFGLWRLRHITLAGGLFVLATACCFAMIGRTAALAFWASVLPAIMFLVLVEAAGRLGIVNWTAIMQGSSEGGANPGWTLMPAVSVEGETYQDIAVRLGMPHESIPFQFQTDSYGFRNTETAAADIIILGDSIVLGAQVPREEVIDRVIGGSLGVPTVQAALLGLSVQEQHDMLLSSGMSLENKLVVQFLFEGNDLLDSKAYRASGGNLQKDRSEMKTGSLLRLLWTQIVNLSNPPAQYWSCLIDGQDYLFLWTQNSFQGLMSEVEPVTQAILDFRDRIRADGADYALVFVPTKYRVLHEKCVFPDASSISTPSEHLSELPNILRAWAASKDIRYLDLTDPLIAATENGQFSWFWGDTHWSRQGHEVAGKAVADWLR